MSGGVCVSDACPRGQHLDAAGQCVVTPVQACAAGKERNAMGQCVIACLPPRKLVGTRCS